MEGKEDQYSLKQRILLLEANMEELKSKLSDHMKWIDLLRRVATKQTKISAKVIRDAAMKNSTQQEVDELISFYMRKFKLSERDVIKGINNNLIQKRNIHLLRCAKKHPGETLVDIAGRKGRINDVNKAICEMFIEKEVEAIYYQEL